MGELQDEEFGVEFIEATTLLVEASTLLRNQEQAQLEAGTTTCSPAGELARRIDAFLSPNTNYLFEGYPQTKSFIKRILDRFTNPINSAKSFMRIEDQHSAIETEVDEIRVERDHYRKALREISWPGSVPVTIKDAERAEAWREVAAAKTRIAETALCFKKATSR